ncbi:MAG: hypothetical protein HXS44_05820 [Theionarchaea archaeon]|nr:hypothetical protein [Theionarchaea archaeon]
MRHNEGHKTSFLCACEIRKSYKLLFKKEVEVKKMDFAIEELEETNPKHPGCNTIRFTVGTL